MNKKRQFADSPDYMIQSEALEYLGMYHPTFNKYANMLSIHGIREGRCTYYLRSDIERLKSVKSNLLTRAIETIEKVTCRRIKEIVFKE